MKYARQSLWGFGIAIVLVFTWIAPLDGIASEQVDAGLKRALVSFATARALNAVISVVQGTEFAAQPAGVGLKFSVGQILKPINDIVEQFAQLMLVASIAFGIEKILISIGAHWMVSLLMTALVLIWGYFHVLRSSAPGWLTKLLLVILMARFAMPIAMIGSDKIFHEFMADEYAESQKSIEGSTSEISSMNTIKPQIEDDQSLLDKAKGLIATTFDVKTKLANLKKSAEQTTERIIKLMAIFTLQTLIIPLLFVWAIWGIVKGTLHTPVLRPKPTT
jgi:hypothetical protein